jgi:tRNA G18 (ribose-2'-O)-methylase SpoU
MEQTPTYDFYLLIYNISKSKNIGTLIRSACAFGIKKVFVLGANKKVLKKFFGSQGTVKKTEFIYFDDFDSLKVFIKENNIFVCGIEIGESSAPIQGHPFKGNTLFVLGNEGAGMNQKQKDLCDQFVYIPHYSNKTGSLNVGVAASIVFHHFGIWAGYKEAEYTGEKYNVEENKVYIKENAESCDESLQSEVI